MEQPEYHDYRDEGGFLVKFNGKDAFRANSVSFDYDTWKYNNSGDGDTPIPSDVQTITIIVEHPE